MRIKLQRYQMAGGLVFAIFSLFACDQQGKNISKPILKRTDIVSGYPERAAACYYLMGKKSEAKDFVEIFRKLHPDYFDDFASKFNSLL